VLSWLIGSQNWSQVLVFTRTKHGANRLAEQLVQDGLTAAAIHGNKSQGARTRALADFKRGAVRVLVATDIAARGLDIDQLPHVVNFDLPEVPEHYVHRIGRTGRAGNEGLAVSLVANDERGLLKDIEKLLRVALPVRALTGYTPAPRPAEPRGEQRPHRHDHRGHTPRHGGERHARSGQRPQGDGHGRRHNQRKPHGESRGGQRERGAPWAGRR
jgi:ATP-dependent RNA helicase RhlE